jgi:hypothetical protein
VLHGILVSFLSQEQHPDPLPNRHRLRRLLEKLQVELESLCRLLFLLQQIPEFQQGVAVTGIELGRAPVLFLGGVQLAGPSQGSSEPKGGGGGSRIQIQGLPVGRLRPLELPGAQQRLGKVKPGPEVLRLFFRRDLQMRHGGRRLFLPQQQDAQVEPGREQVRLLFDHLAVLLNGFRVAVELGQGVGQIEASTIIGRVRREGLFQQRHRVRVFLLFERSSRVSQLQRSQ